MSAFTDNEFWENVMLFLLGAAIIVGTFYISWQFFSAWSAKNVPDMIGYLAIYLMFIKDASGSKCKCKS